MQQWTGIDIRRHAAAFGVVSVLTIAFLGAYVAVTEPSAVLRSRRCVGRTTPWYACVPGPAVPFQTDYFGMQYRGHTANLIDRHVLLFGAYEKSLLYFLRDVLQASSHAAPVFVDVGANVGQHALFLSQHAATVHAFEPYDVVVARFRSMIAANGVTNIVVHSVGLGEASSTKAFFSPPAGNLGTGSFVPSFGDNDTSATQALPLVAGDDALQGVSSIAAIKIDIEGFEQPALKGLRRTLHAHRPTVALEISTDSTSEVSFKSFAQLAATFPPDYEFRSFAGDPESGRYQFGPFTAQARFDIEAQYNVVAIPRESRVLRR